MLLVACGFFALAILACMVVWAFLRVFPIARDPITVALSVATLTLSLVIAADPGLNYRFASDDAFYYLKPARYVANTGTPTFDGLHETNGWHPLWLCMLAALHKIQSPTPDGFVTSAAIVNWLLLLGSFALLLELMAGLLSRWAQIIVLVSLANPWVTTRFWPSLMENLCAQFLILVCLIALKDVFSSEKYKPTTYLLLAGASSMLIMARLDMFLFVGFLVSVLLFQSCKGTFNISRSFRLLVVCGLIIVIPISLYMIWNYANFGHIESVSAYVKVAVRGGHMQLIERYDSLCALIPSLPRLCPVPILRIVSPFVLAASFVCAFTLLRTVPRGGYRVSIGLLWAYAATHFLLVKLSSTEAFFWYYTAEILAIALGIGLLAESVIKWCEPSPVTKYSLVSIGLILNIALTSDALSNSPRLFYSNHIQHIFCRQFAEWIHVNLPADTVLGSWDAGMIGYYSELSVVNLDGLVNSFEYVEYMKRGAYREYVREKGIQYIVNVCTVGCDGSVVLPLRPGSTVLTPLLDLKRTGSLFSRSLAGEADSAYALFQVRPEENVE